MANEEDIEMNDADLDVAVPEAKETDPSVELLREKDDNDVAEFLREKGDFMANFDDIIIVLLAEAEAEAKV